MSNAPKQNTTSTHSSAEAKHSSKQIGVVAALTLVGTILLGVATGFIPTNKAHADESTSTTVSQIEGAIDSGVAKATSGTDYVDPATAGAVTNEVKKGGTCTITLPANSPWLDRVKATFKEAGCSLNVYKLDNGNVDAELSADHATTPSTTTTK